MADTSNKSKPDLNTSLCFDDDDGCLLELWEQILHAHDTKVNRKLSVQLAYSYPIPHDLRSNAWFILSDARELCLKNRNIYNHLIHTKPSNKHAIEQIEKDILRTFGTKEMSDQYSSKLRKILVAYSNCNVSVSYTQGMNYIAAFILRQFFEKSPNISILDEPTESKTENEDDENEIVNDYWMPCVEEQAFWTFTAIMTQISTLFSNELVGFHKAVECFEKLFNYHGPKDLVAYLNEKNVYKTVFTTWYHTLFTHPSMNENMVKRIWDIFIVEKMDFSIILKVSYLILIRHKSVLMQMDFIQICDFCKSKECFVFDGVDDHDLIQRAYKLNLNELYLKPVRNLKHIEYEEIEENHRPLGRIWDFIKRLPQISPSK